LALLQLVVTFAIATVHTHCVDPRSFGAVEGNPGANPGPNWQRNTKAIQAAIDAPGDCVAVDGGDYVTSDLLLRSNMVFRILQGSRLLTAVNQTVTAVLRVSRARNVTLEGHGVVYGSAEDYISYYQPDDNRFQPTAPDGARPNLLVIEESQDVLVKDLQFRNSSDKNIIVRKASDVTIDGVTIYSDHRYPNTDGIHPSSCTRLTVRPSIALDWGPACLCKRLVGRGSAVTDRVGESVAGREF
jgi:polygalacturonase